MMMGSFNKTVKLKEASTMKITKMDFKDLTKYINSNRLMLPAWQREYVWDLNRIAILFDSIFKGYPVSNILLWETQNKECSIFYSFLRICQFSGNKVITENNNADEEKSKVIGVLDGQQRLTSVYLVIDNNCKIYNKNKNGIEKEYKLKVNFLCEDENFEFSFKDKTIDEGWFDVKKLFNDSNYFIDTSKKSQFSAKDKNKAKKKYKKFINIKNNFEFNCSPVKVDCKTALEIFDRINTQGQGLTMPEMTYSLLVHENTKLRKELNNELKRLNNNAFKFKIDFFIKIIMLIQFGRAKYNYKDIEEHLNEIYKKWKKVFSATKTVCKLLKSYKMSDSTISSYNAIVPIVYYFYKKGSTKISKEEARAIIFYLRLCMIKGLFGGSSDETINKMYDAVTKLVDSNKTITKNWIKKLSIESDKDGKSFTYTNDDIENWVKNLKKGAKVTKMVLRMLYTGHQYDKVEFDDDHMHPQVMFKKTNNYNNKTIRKMDEWNRKCQMLPNLQVLKSEYNRVEKNKKPLSLWIAEHKDYLKKDNYINDKIKKNLDFNSFDIFYNERMKMMKNELKRQLDK